MGDIGYEKLIQQVKRLNSGGAIVFLGTMKTDVSVSIGDLTLYQDDLMVNDNIEDLKQGDTVLIIKISDEKYAIMGRVRDL